MDYTKTSNTIRMMMKAQGIDEKYIDKKETLYYDESGNVKHLIVKEGRLNAETDTVFVLGGVQTDDIISLEELKTALCKSPEKELKSTKDLKGSFIEILRKNNLKKLLQLIQDKKWHIHFTIVQILYYGFVDIVDSIDGLDADPFAFKAELYKVLKKNPNTTLSIFKKYKYPHLASGNTENFLAELLTLIDIAISADASKGLFRPLLGVLRNCIERSKEQKELTFIQDEATHVWVENFVQFYKYEILKYPKKTLVFDEEKQVMGAIAEEKITIDGIALGNYCFKESGSDPMIQVCDYVVCILRKYIMFLDRLESEVNADIQSFDETQMSNYKLLNNVLADSLKYNPLFENFIASQHTIAKYHKYMNMYSGNNEGMW